MDNTETTSGGQDPIIEQLQKSLTDSAGMVSSETSGVQDTITSAINQVKTGQSATETRINSAFGRESAYGIQQGQRNVDAFAEARQGFATQQAALRNLVGETDKYMGDLLQRKEEALAMNDANAANSISELLVTGQKMKMDALQNAFNNIVQVTRFGMDAYQYDKNFTEGKRQFQLSYELDGEKFQLEKDSLSSQEKQAMAGIATEFGITMAPDETIDSIVSRAAQTGAVSERRALELESLRASIAASNATAARALKDLEAPKAYDSIMLEVFANEVRAGRATVSDLADTPEKYAQLRGVINQKDTLEQESISRLRSFSASDAEFEGYIQQLSAGLSPEQVSRIQSYSAYAGLNTPLGGKTSKQKESEKMEAVSKAESYFKGSLSQGFKAK